MSSLGTHLLGLVGATLSLVPARATAAKYMVVFGDSYSTTNSWVGSTAPSTSNPIGNPTFPGQTTSGGYNWVGNAIAKQNTTEVFAYDLAVTGATTDNEIVATYAQYNFDDQVETLFSTYLSGSAAPWDSAADDVLVTVWFGINDVGEPFWDGISAPIDTILDRYFGLLDELYADGMRNYVLFTIPPFDRAPAIIYEDATRVASLHSDIQTYNAALATRLATFKSTYGDVTAQLFDTTSTFETVLDNPTAYGAPDATCVNGDGTSCIWADTYHPGLVIHELLAEALVKAVDFF
ncbi:carbohydrate esterase family 16 protein [Xylaria sp. FL1042]|nr:carbohydrate esterase family 16 protein [Xylaria sp. FL1042]